MIGLTKNIQLVLFCGEKEEFLYQFFSWIIDHALLNRTTLKNEIYFDPVVFFEFKRRVAIDFVLPFLIQRGTKSQNGPWHQRKIEMYCQVIQKKRMLWQINQMMRWVSLEMKL